MDKAWRLFIALELPDEVVEQIGRLQGKLKRTVPSRAARWVDPHSIHLTLKFLGDVPVEEIDAIKDGVAQAAKGHPSLRLAVQGLGCFPDTKRPRVLWLGVTGNLDALQALQASVEEHVAPLGYPVDERGFSPHLTLARTGRQASREEAAALGRAAENGDGSALAGWQAARVSLMRSQLKPDGAVYTRVFEAELNG